MKIDITVRVDGLHWSGGAAIVVPELMEHCFEPMDDCDEPALFGGVSHAQARRVMKVRKDAAEFLATTLAHHIVKEMSKHDTSNGYPIDQGVHNGHDNIECG